VKVSGVSVQVSAQPLVAPAASLIEIETFGTWFRNRPLLGFAIRTNTGKMWVGMSATKPNEAWSRLNPTYKGKVAQDRTNSNF
jgi:hypothetical protein